MHVVKTGRGLYRNEVRSSNDPGMEPFHSQAGLGEKEK
jgi:hypothetical protein